MNEPLPIKIPSIVRRPSRVRVAPYAIAVVAIGTGVYAGLATTRTNRERQEATLPVLAQAPTAVVTPAPLPVAPSTPPPSVPAVIPTTSAPQPVIAPHTAEKAAPVVEQGTSPDPSAADKADKAKARLNSPALIVDLGPTPASFDRGSRLQLVPASFSNDAPAPTAPIPTAPVPTVAVPGPAGPAIAVPAPATVVTVEPDPATRDLNGNERFAQRAGNRETEVVRAQRLPNQDSLVVQGTLIAGVMETALNSDLPGFARAIVTRDVLSFDGSQVLIPAGTRVIGEYNSGVSQGASRIFIVWNRLIRPDGVSVAIGSPAVDDLGRGGLAGKVNRHFFQRFGGAILLSVLGSGANLLTQSLNRNSTVIVSSNSEASSLGGAAARPGDIAPTITTPQGATVQIFVARDLDFSGVGPAS